MEHNVQQHQNNTCILVAEQPAESESQQLQIVEGTILQNLPVISLNGQANNFLLLSQPNGGAQSLNGNGISPTANLRILSVGNDQTTPINGRTVDVRPSNG